MPKTQLVKVISGGGGGGSTSDASAANQVAQTAKLSAIDTQTASIDTKATGLDTKLGSIDTKSGSIDSRLGTIDTKAGSIDTKVTGLDTKLGSIDTKSSSIDSRLGTIDAKLGNIDTKNPALGNALAAASVPVTVASDQAALKVCEPGTGVVNGSITAVSQRVQAGLTTFNGAAIYLAGTYNTVNVSFEVSYDSAATWIAVTAVAVTGTAPLTATGNQTNTAQAYEVWSPGATHVSVRSTAYTSGTLTVRISPAVFFQDPNPVIVGALNANQSVNNAQWGGTNIVTGGVNGTVGVGGTAADSAAASGNPVQTGGRVRTAVDTTLVASDAMAMTGTSGMQLLVKPYGLPETDWQFTGVITTATATAARAAGAAGVRNYVTGVQYQNTSATASEIQVQDGAAAVWRAQAPANMAAPAVVTFQTPLRGTAATALNVQMITTGGNTFVNLQGYQAA